MPVDRRIPTDMLRRELERIVHQGHIRSFRLDTSGRRRRVRITWTDGTVQEAEVATTMGILRALQEKGEA